MDAFTQAYLECAIWSSTDEEGQPLDKFCTYKDLEPDTLAKMQEDCASFQAKYGEDIASDPGQAGHDFWLSRNGHGSGFFDSIWPEEIGDKLQDAAQIYGEFNLYLGDNGKIDH